MRPDISHLPRVDQINLRVEEVVFGATWQKIERGAVDWVLNSPHASGMAVLWTDGRYDPHAVRNFVVDPAAWDLLMEKEGLSLVKYGSEWEAFKCSVSQQEGGGRALLHFGTYRDLITAAPTRGEAVARAALHEYGILFL